MIIGSQLCPAVPCVDSTPNDALYVVVTSDTTEKYVTRFDGDVYLEI
jgi:hypothetical protein